MELQERNSQHFNHINLTYLASLSLVLKKKTFSATEKETGVLSLYLLKISHHFTYTGVANLQ